MGQKQRQLLAEKMASIQEDDERLILATGQYLGEGFDDACLDTLFLVGGDSWKKAHDSYDDARRETLFRTLPVSRRGTLAQYAGRLHHLHHAKR
jgi:hypothetical protein